MKKLSPVLLVESIEAALPFWVDRLGFQKVAEVPHGAHLGFVILVQGAVEVMLQTRASVAADIPALAQHPAGSFLYVEVDDLDAVAAKLKGAELVMPRRQTPYGMDELIVHAPGGHVVAFSAPVRS